MTLKILNASCIFILSLLFIHGGIAQTPAVTTKSKPTDVIILGTIHQTHDKNPKYSPQVLRDIIIRLKPVEILFEMPSTEDGKPTIVHDRMAFGDKDESWAANAAADSLNIPVIAYDEEGRDEIYKETNYFARQDSLDHTMSAYRDDIQKNNPTSLEAKVAGDFLINVATSQWYFSLYAGPEVINSLGYDLIVQTKQQDWYEVCPKLLSTDPKMKALIPEFNFFFEQWNERNKIMAKNIVEAARKKPSGRIVVLCGAEHRYMLRNLLAKESDITLKEYYEISD